MVITVGNQLISQNRFVENMNWNYCFFKVACTTPSLFTISQSFSKIQSSRVFKYICALINPRSSKLPSETLTIFLSAMSLIFFLTILAKRAAPLSTAFAEGKQSPSNVMQNQTASPAIMPWTANVSQSRTSRMYTTLIVSYIFKVLVGLEDLRDQSQRAVICYGTSFGMGMRAIGLQIQGLRILGGLPFFFLGRSTLSLSQNFTIVANMNSKKQLTRTFSYQPLKQGTKTQLLPRYQKILDKVESQGTLLAKCPKQLFDHSEQKAGQPNQRLREQVTIKAVELSKIREISTFLLSQNEELRASLTTQLESHHQSLTATLKDPVESSSLKRRIVETEEQNRLLTAHLKQFQAFREGYQKMEGEVGADVGRVQDQAEDVRAGLQESLQREFLVAQRIMLCWARIGELEVKGEKLAGALLPKQQEQHTRKQNLLLARRQSTSLKQSLQQCQLTIQSNINPLQATLHTFSTKLTDLKYQHTDLLQKNRQTQAEVNRLKELQKQGEERLVEVGTELGRVGVTLAGLGREVEEVGRKRETACGEVERVANEIRFLKKRIEGEIKELQKDKARMAIENVERKKRCDTMVEDIRGRMRQAVREREMEIQRLVRHN